MTNPYSPPSSTNRYRPFHRRFARALRMAVREYRAGMAREGVSIGGQIRAWLTLLAIVGIGLGGLVVGAFFVLLWLGVV